MSPFRPTIKADRGGIAAGRDVHVGLDEAAMTAAIARFADNDAERRALQDEVNRLRSQSHILDRAIITLLQDVGERIGDPSLYPEQLRRAGERYQELLAEAERPRNLPPQFEEVRREAAALIREGRLDEADARLASLRQEMATWRAEQQAMLDQARRDEATILAERAQIAHTRLRYRSAAVLFAEAADLTSFDPETSWRHRLDQGNTLLAQGKEFGDNAALHEASATYEVALVLAPREQRPNDWAATQNHLGIALSVLGDRESVAATLDRAVKAFESALQERTRDRVPLDWAMTQCDLGTARMALGRRASGTTILESAVRAYEEALQECTREGSPLVWAMIQNNLGNAAYYIGERNSDTAILKRAVKACKAALLERTRERVPLHWAATQSNLGNALTTLGTLESNTATLRSAVKVYQMALLETHRERLPLDWAAIQSNMGHALLALGVLKGDLGTLKLAVDAYEAALLERTRERVPLEWALTQHTLAIGRMEIGRQRRDAGQLRAALAAVDCALEEYRAEKAEYNIKRAERLRGLILAAIDEQDR